MMEKPLTSPRVGLVIPTLNAGADWTRCLDAVDAQSQPFQRRVVIDSASTDATPALARERGYEVIPIERSEFNHGGTRQWAAEQLEDCEIVLFLTQDAILATPDAAARLVACFDDPAIVVAYGRQLPHADATPIATHAREFNYPAVSQRKDRAAGQVLGNKVFFCSNSFSAYRREALLALGGFRSDLILGEDAEFAARAIRAGYVNMYCAGAMAHHSHNYSTAQDFRRYFDTGVFHARNPWMLDAFGSASGEGMKFVASEVRFLWQRSPGDVPAALVRTAAKLAGYRLGRAESWLSSGLKKRLSMHAGYWR